MFGAVVAPRLVSMDFDPLLLELAGRSTLEPSTMPAVLSSSMRLGGAELTIGFAARAGTSVFCAGFLGCAGSDLSDDGGADPAGFEAAAGAPSNFAMVSS